MQQRRVVPRAHEGGVGLEAHRSRRARSAAALRATRRAIFMNPPTIDCTFGGSFTESSAEAPPGIPSIPPTIAIPCDQHPVVLPAALPHELDGVGALALPGCGPARCTRSRVHRTWARRRASRSRPRSPSAAQVTGLAGWAAGFGASGDRLGAVVVERMGEAGHGDFGERRARRRFLPAGPAHIHLDLTGPCRRTARRSGNPGRLVPRARSPASDPVRHLSNPPARPCRAAAEDIAGTLGHPARRRRRRSNSGGSATCRRSSRGTALVSAGVRGPVARAVGRAGERAHVGRLAPVREGTGIVGRGRRRSLRAAAAGAASEAATRPRGRMRSLVARVRSGSSSSKRVVSGACSGGTWDRRVAPVLAVCCRATTGTYIRNVHDRAQPAGPPCPPRPGRPGLGSLPAQPKRFALLAYLAIGAGTGYHRRDSLAAMFWPDMDQFAARRALRNTLYHLREALGDGVIVTRGDDARGRRPGPAHLRRDPAERTP